MPPAPAPATRALAVRTSIASRDVGSTPGGLAVDQGGQDALAGRPALGRLAVGQADAVPRRPWRSHWISGSDRKTRASSQGIGTFWAAILGFRSDERALALRLASRTGLSTESPLALLVGPGPGAGVPLDPAGPALDLDQPEALLGQDQQVDLVDGAVGRPGTRSWPRRGRARGRAGRRGRSPARPAPTGTARA